jgi:membrane protein
MRWHDTWDLIKQTGKEFVDDKAPRLGAAMAFYTALSFAPLLLAVVGIVGLVYGDQAARGEIANQISSLVGREQAEVLEGALARSASPTGGILATVIGVVVLFFGATGLFAELQSALDTVWNVKADETPRGVWGYIKDRLLSLSMVGGMAFLLLVSLVFSAVLSGFGSAFESWLPYSSIWLRLGNCVISFALTTLMFAMIFRVLPHKHIAWRDVWIGAAVTALLFNGGKYLIGLYLGRASVGSTFGAAGSFVVFLVWVYYSTQILLLGAEFTQVYATKYGSGWEAQKAENQTPTPGNPAIGTT